MDVLRTPDERFENVVDFPYEPSYADVLGLRMHYVDTGPPNALPVLLLHGEPAWAFLYRKMIPIITGAGYRAIVPDHPGRRQGLPEAGSGGEGSAAHHDRGSRPFPAG